MRKTPFLCLTVAWAFLLTACGASAAGQDGDPADHGHREAAAEASTDFPMTIDNCGTEVEIDQPPQQVVSIKSTSTEMLLALGLEDRLVGTAFEDSPVPDAWADQAAEVPTISDGVPSQEALLTREPDFVFAGWESNFSAESAGSRESLHQIGVGTYVSPAACQAEGYMPQNLGFDDVFSGIYEVGSIFGVSEAAEELVSQQRQVLDEVEALNGDLTALWYSSGTDTPYVGAGKGAPAMIMEELGLNGVADDVDDTWASLSWEVIAERDPEVIILIDAEWNTAEDKIALLESNPVTANIEAVREGNYASLPFAASEAGVRNAEAVADLAEQLQGVSQ